MSEHDQLVWINGDLKPASEGAVSALDHGLVVGDAAFETLQIVDGVPFAVARHLRRLNKTLTAMSIDSPADSDLREAMVAVVDANGLQSGKVRLTVTGGVGPLGSGKPHGPATVVAAADGAIPDLTPRAVTVPWTRNEMGATAGLKTTSYAENVRALRYAHDHDASEALFANTRGELCEGTGTNVFVVIDGRVHTPPLASGCLAGITRGLVMDLVDVVEAAMALDILETADEVFLTSSTRDVQGIVMVDQRELGEPGPVTVEVASSFSSLKAAEIDP